MRWRLLGLAFGVFVSVVHGRIARADGPVPVVATFSVLADITAAIGGDAVAVTSLVPVDGDAHTYEPRPSDLVTLKGAKVLVKNGLGLEGWLDRLARSADFIGLTVVATRGVASRKMDEDGKIITDPHAWQDPRNGMIYARNIAEALAVAIPAHAAAIHDRADTYIRQIEEIDAWADKTLGAVPEGKRQIITSHDAFGYFGARFGITFHGVQGIDTDAEPSARDVATLVKQVRREHIKAVFVENMTDPRFAQMLAREAGATLGPAVYSDALSAPGGPADTYLEMFRHNVPLFARAMAAN